MEKPEYQLIRSKRKTMGLEVNIKGVTVRAPVDAPQADIDKFVFIHRKWIEKHLEKMAERKKEISAMPCLTAKDIQLLSKKAMEVIPKRAAFYADQIGVTYGKITIRHQKSCWGSCSSAGNLSFNCLLMLFPLEAVDAVVVHELCHRKEMNHSLQFYREVYKVYPDYKKWHDLLKEKGSLLMAGQQK